MTTLLDLLSRIGHAAWDPIWVPVLAWTLLALPLWALLRRTDRLHPHAEYRLLQVLLAALPVGVGAAALFDGWSPASTALSGVGPGLVVMPPVEASAGASSSPALAWMHAVGLATLAAAGGALAGLVRLSLDAAAAARVRAEAGAGESPDTLQSRADRLSTTLGVRRPVRVHVAPEAEVPVTLGGLRPLVLLPPHLAEDPEALQMTLRHELVHVRRYDDLAHLAERLVAALGTAHPLVGRLAAQVAEARERACDAAVLADGQTSAGAYARLLTAFADRPPARRLGALSLSESPSSLTSRLRAMTSSVSDWLSSPVSLAASLLALGLIVVLGVVACSDSVAPTASSENPASPSGETSTAGEPGASDEVYVEVEQRPECGGVQALAKHIQYPELAREAGIEGRVFVQFVVDENGDVTDPTVTKGVHETLDAAALSAVQELECKPGQVRGEPVKVRMTLPVTFALPDSNATTAASSASSEAQSTFTVPNDGSIAPDRAPIAEKQENTPPYRPPAKRIDGGLEALYENLEYPTLAQKAGIEGRVLLKFTIDESGEVQNPRVIETPHRILGEASVEALQQISFEPAESGGAPTTAEMTLPITFKLPEE